MFNARSPKSNQRASCTFPNTKLKNISCIFCRHQFYIRDLGDPNGTQFPLLLNCGHAACQHCATNRAWDPCPLCKTTVESGSSELENLLPANVYVIGLIGVARGRPVHGDEPDITFSQTITARMKQRSTEQGNCYKCTTRAVLRCLQCDALLCHTCYSKIHNKLEGQGQNEEHFRVMLTDRSNDSMFETKKCNRHNDIHDYYCENCELSGCAHCMVEFHQRHKVVAQSVKNEEYVEDFRRAHDKLAETMQRVRQAQKKLQKALVFPNELQNSETIEAAINQHFTHLHGVIQNTERRMIDKLYEQRNYLAKNLHDIQQRLKLQEEQVQSGLSMAARINEIQSKVDLKDVIAKLEKLADVPCHLVKDPIAEDEKITFSPDRSIIEILENHCKIEVPEVAGFNLLTKETLPMDYEMEPIDIEKLPSVLDSTFSVETPLTRSQSCQSLSSRRPETQLLKQKGYNLVHVCYIDSPSNFYVQLTSHQRKTIELQDELANYAENKIRVPHYVQQNKIYAVKRSGDKWYRGRVNAINTNHGSPDTYEVFNVDYGKTEHRVIKSRMRSIPRQLATMPQTIINCALYDIVPKDGKWRSEALKSMSEIVKPKDGRAVAMYIVNVKENMYLVDICREASNDATRSLVSVRDSLIFSGYGTFVTSQQLLRTSPQSVRRFFREDLNLETYYDVKCSHVESPDCIYVQKAGDHLIHLATLITEMSKVYNEVIKHKNGMIYVPEIGIPCAVQKAEGVWCRGIISDVPAPRTVEVTLVDFGARVTTNYEKIRKLHENYMISPGQAIKVSLADIKSFDGQQWSKQAIEFTKEYIEETLARIVAFEKIEFGYNVALYINDDENFAAILASSSFAVSTGPRSSGVAVVENKEPNPKNENPQSKVRNIRTVGKKNRRTNEHSDKRISSAIAVTETVAIDPFRLQVKIIRAESPDMIYVADPIHEKEYNKMMDQMQNFYNGNETTSVKGEWDVDLACAVYSKCNKLFCRGKIVAIKSSDEAEVFLYDLAFTETVPIADLQVLRNKFWHARTYAFKVRLGGISPCGGSSGWPLSSCEKLKQLIFENQNSKFYISKVDHPGETELYVDLYVEQLRIDGPLAPAIFEINCINHMLVEMGLALPIKKYKEKTKVLAVELKRQILHADQEQKNETFKLIENDESNSESDEESSLSSSSTSSAPSLALSQCTLLSDDEIPTSWLPAEVITDDKFVAVTTYVDHDCCLHLHSVTKSGNLLRSIEKTVQAKYAKLVHNAKDLEWEVGDLCIAQYHGNKKWYRARVLRVSGKDTIEVEFIDYGNVEECEIGMLSKRLVLTHVPRQSTKCVIYGLHPNTPNHTWRTHELDIIHSLLVDQKCEVTVQKRKEDHLVVSIELLKPVRCDLIKYLANKLEMDIRVYFAEKTSDIEIESTIDDSDDVIIDGDSMDKESSGDDGKVNEKEIENKKSDDFNAKDIENDKDCNDNQEDYDDKNDENESTVIGEIPIAISAKNSRKTIFSNKSDTLSATDPTNLSYSAEEVILSGHFSHIAGEMKLSEEEAMSEPDSISLPDSTCLREDKLVTSTPFDSMDCGSYYSYKQLVFPDEVKIVKAEVAVITPNVFWLHLLDDKKSEIITIYSDIYEDIVAEMQKYAKKQPVLKYFEKGTPCCVKFIDDLWYRGVVVDCDSPIHASNDTVKVCFVDWGNSTDVRSDEVRTMKDEWFEAPYMSLPCRLWNVEKIPIVVSNDFREKLRAAYGGNDIPPKAVYVELMGYVNGIYDVRVYSDEECTKLIY